MRLNPEERSYHLLRGGSLKSQKALIGSLDFFVIYFSAFSRLQDYSFEILKQFGGKLS
jgi:hypothetical protein